MITLSIFNAFNASEIQYIKGKGFEFIGYFLSNTNIKFSGSVMVGGVGRDDVFKVISIEDKSTNRTNNLIKQGEIVGILVERVSK